MPELNWPTIGVCWALTTATTVVLFVVFTIVTRTLRKRRKHRKPGSDRNGVWSTVSDYKSESGQTVPLMEMTSNPSRPNGSSSNRPNSCPNERRKQDDVSRWCSEHGLPECFVNTLREHGFESKVALDALRPDDLEGNPANLPLKSAALKVQLREVLIKLHGESIHKKSTSCSRRNPEFAGHSLSDSGMASDPHSPTNSSDVFLPGLSSIDEVDSGGRRGPRRGGEKGGAGNGKGQPTSSITSDSHRKSSRTKSQPHFNGLLSDKGLWQITDKLGYEWRHLASLLGITTQTQEQLMENHPHKVKNSIYEMLTMWRNQASGNKEQIKGKLHKALMAVERNDIAQLLLDEQTHGSDKNINSISSII